MGSNLLSKESAKIKAWKISFVSIFSFIAEEESFFDFVEGFFGLEAEGWGFFFIV